MTLSERGTSDILKNSRNSHYKYYIQFHLFCLIIWQSADISAIILKQYLLVGSSSYRYVSFPYCFISLPPPFVNKNFITTVKRMSFGEFKNLNIFLFFWLILIRKKVLTGMFVFTNHTYLKVLLVFSYINIFQLNVLRAAHYSTHKINYKLLKQKKMVTCICSHFIHRH